MTPLFEEVFFRNLSICGWCRAPMGARMTRTTYFDTPYENRNAFIHYRHLYSASSRELLFLNRPTGIYSHAHVNQLPYQPCIHVRSPRLFVYLFHNSSDLTQPSAEPLCSARQDLCV